MTGTELAALKRRLIAEQQYLLAQIDGQMAEQELLAQASGEERVSASDDAASEIFEHEKTLAVEEAFEEMLSEVRHALHKIDAGSYGLCDDCGQPIAIHRLKARPQASLCVTCKLKEERAQHGRWATPAVSGA